LFTEPVPDVEFEVVKVTVPPAPVLLKAVTIELLSIIRLPVEGIENPCEINVKLPVVFTVIFVKVLLLMLVVKLALAIVMRVIVAVPATVCPNV